MSYECGDILIALLIQSNFFQMKRYSILLVSLFYLSQISSAQNYLPNDSLYVWAVSGLKMRAKPDLKGEKIMTIPYGEKIKIERMGKSVLTINIMPADKDQHYTGFELEGHWRKVYYQDTSGYVFDGYLSSLPTVNISFYKNEANKQRFRCEEDIMQWAERNYGLLDTLVRTDSVYWNFEKRYIYGNGLVFRQIASEKSGGYNIIIPQTNLREIFLLYNIVYRLEDGIKFKDDGYWKVSKSNPLQIDVYVDGCSDSIQQIEWSDVILVFSQCSC